MIRCGIAIYGMDPFHRDPAEHGLEPALELVSYVAEVKRARAGESVGYGRRFIAERDTWIATIPIGYGDGVRRGLTDRPTCWSAGGASRWPGRSRWTTSPSTSATSRSSAAPRPSCSAAAASERILAEDWARALGTINYEITCGLSSRVPRHHK